MTDYRARLASCTLERYETEFADRHLLHGVLEKWAREKPDQTAIHEFDTGRDYSYAELDELTTTYALKLIEMGYRPGDYLATMLPLSAEHVLLEYACFKIGVVHAPLDLRLKAPEVIRSLQMIQAKGFACLGPTKTTDYGELAQEVQKACPFVEHLIQFAPTDATIAGAMAFESFAGDAMRIADAAITAQEQSPVWCAYAAAHANVAPSDGAQVIYTTGSTGLPKPALLSHRNITSQNMCLATGFDLAATPRMLVNLPPSHVGCQGEELMTTLFIGGTAVVLHLFDAEKSLQAIQEQGVTCIGQIPAMFHMLWQLPNFADYDLSSLKMALFGGQQVTAPFVERLKKMAPNAATGLGLTEMAGFVTYTDHDCSVDDLVASVGDAMPITPLTIRQPMKADGSAGDELPAGETGEICFSGPQVFIDYVNNREAYRQTVSLEGICYTGDLGYVSPRGLIFCGRSKLVIKAKGYQVHPAQIEQHFAILRDQVAVCGAVGALHDFYSEGVVLFIECKPNVELSRAQLDAHAQGIAAYMRPLHYVIMPPGAFPLNRVAKTDYVKLGELAQAEIEALRAKGGWDRQSAAQALEWGDAG